MRKISRIICLLVFVLTSFTGHAQREFTPVHGDCMPDGPDRVTMGSQKVKKKMPVPNTEWNPEKIYRQLVVIFDFPDTTFSCSNEPRAFYDKMFNEPGYNVRKGPGCVADYYRDQSGGLLNLQFDVYGPVTVSSKSQPLDNPTSSSRNYGRDDMQEAMKKVIDEHPEIDFSVYDWNGDKEIEQVVFIYAGWPGNTSDSRTFGHIWPNTSYFSSITTPDGYMISSYTCSGEVWPSSSLLLCGLGTVCHEFTHSLGLPDIYPTAGNAGFSVCDEWDLMDGGNFTNYGWCPPNFTPMEKWLLGWLSFVDLEEPTIVTDMKPAAEGGEVYRIKHSETEWLLLENRQQRGWDSGAPGKGLVIYHVDYNQSKWRSNTVNNKSSKRCFELIHADNMDYDAWVGYRSLMGYSNYQNKGYMNSNLLSTSPYPWTTDSTDFVNNSLTGTSVPAPVMNNANEVGETIMNKPITNIQMTEDGLISFEFMGTSPVIDGVDTHTMDVELAPSVYDLSGRRVSQTGRGLFLVRDRHGKIRKVFQ